MNISVRQIREEELEESDRLFRLAFGTQYGLVNPIETFGDRDMVVSRWRGGTSVVLVAAVAGRVRGVTVVTKWGSVGFIGRLAIDPQMWGRGLGSRLIERAEEMFDRWNISQAGLVTEPGSPKHIHLYQKYGFWPRYPTAIMTKPVNSSQDLLTVSTFSDLERDERRKFIKEAFHLTNSIYKGLDLSAEIRAVHHQAFGDTILLREGSKLEGFAICHCGAHTEAGSGNCYVKFGAVRPSNPRRGFRKLVKTCEAFAARKGLANVVAGMNMERHEAYKIMLETGFTTSTLFVTMHKPNEPAYNRSDVFVMDWWS